MTTNELIRCYVADRSEAAFAELVRQHIDLVYSAAIRQVNGDEATAQDVTQAVFTDLAHKAPRLVRHTALAGWLYTSTRYLAAKARRAEQRRLVREQEAHVMNQLLQPAESDVAWQELRPLLDDVMHELNAADRDAVLMRYFERQPLAEIGARLGLSENTARMRVERALDKLRVALARHGVTSTAAALAGILTQRASGAAPAELAGQVSHAAFGAAAAGLGISAVLLNSLTAMPGKLLFVAGATALVAGLLVLPRLSPTPPAAPAGVPPTEELVAGVATALLGNSPTSPSDSNASLPGWASSSNKLVLHIVTADTGKPVPSVTIDYVLIEATNYSHQQFQATRFGVCEIPVPRSTVTRLLLCSQIDGFADTWLQWLPDRGDQIPEAYTLQLSRAIQIGGRVVDADGQPVAGASVGFYMGGRDPLSDARPETHAGLGITGAPTDSAGRWSLSRIAPEVFRRMTGIASHAEHIDSRISVAEDAATENQLLAGAYVFRLGRAITLSGVILDPESRPVTGAKLLIRNQPHAAIQLRHPETNQADGAFILTGCLPGTNTIRVEAEAFSSAQVEVCSETNPPPLRIILQRGKLLRLRVMGRAGTPVPGAQVEFTNAITIRQTDAEGRLEWDGAATEDVTLTVRASGYVWTKNVTVKADGQEHLITLSPSLTISGTVRDALTGQPVPHFRVIPGWPRMAASHAAIQWQLVDPIGWTSSADGKFRQMVGEAVDQNTELVFKFDAVGYAPFVTRVVRSNEGEVQFEVVLLPAASLTISVLLPDGNAAAYADLGLVSSGDMQSSQLRVRPGGLSRGNTYPTGMSVPTTDDQGRFPLPPDDDVIGVIVANQQGYAEVSRAALAVEPIIRLQPWGRIEGMVLSGGRAAAGSTVAFQYGSNAVNSRITADLFAYQTTADNDGRFVFAQVPPGRHRVARLMPRAPGGQPAFMLGGTSRILADVEARAGETTTVTLGGSNYTVMARLRWPAELKRDPNSSVRLSLQKPAPAPPEELSNDPEALAAWRARPEIAAASSLSRRPLTLLEQADGTFLAENVPPGSYELVAAIYDVPSVGGRASPQANARIPVTIPADPPTGTLDLGEIAVRPAN